MNYKRIGRALVCLLLVCCLIVNVSPVKAKAVVSSTSVLAVSAAVVAVSLLCGLGVSRGAGNTDFNNLVGNAVSAMKDSGVIITNGLMDIISIGGGRYGVKSSLIQDLFDWLYAERVVVHSLSGIPSSYLEGYYGALQDFTESNENSNPYVFYRYYTSSVYYLYFSPYPFTRKDSSYFNSLDVNGNEYGASFYKIYRDGFSSWGSSTFFLCDSHGWGTFSVASPVVANGDYVLNSVASPGTNIATGYAEWAANSTTITNTETGEDVVYYPIGFGQTYDETVGMTQEDVWLGILLEDVVVETTPSSPTDPTEEGENIPGAGAVTATLLQRLFGGVQEKLDATYISIREIPDLLRDFMLDVKKGFEELPSKFAEWFSNIQTSLELLVSGQLTIGQLLSEFISPLVDAFKALLQSLFSPSADFIANKVNSLIAKYPYLNTFLGLGADLKAYFLSLGTQPPIIYIDLGAATGSYYFGGRQAFIDLTWYSTYKPTMDAILGAFIWLWLAWRIFLTLPSIINGGSGAAGSIIRYSERSSKTPDGGADK